MSHKIREKILTNLMDALIECNNAGYDNDLPATAHDDDNAYGDICNAIRNLGGGAVLDSWHLTGDRADDPINWGP